MKTFAIGDMHGGHKAFLQCIERSGIDRERDRLICLGDVADGWPEVPQCFDELLTFKNLVYVIGNHDEWLLNYFKYDMTPSIWLNQGGRRSLQSYVETYGGPVPEHVDLLENALPYFVLDDYGVDLFVHGGFDWHEPIAEQSWRDLTWDRHLWQTACMWHTQKSDKVKQYDRVFVGHTTTAWLDEDTLKWKSEREINSLKPIKAANVWNLDQGGGYEGKLTIMDVETEEYWQSDVVKTLYPGYSHR